MERHEEISYDCEMKDFNDLEDFVSKLRSAGFSTQPIYGESWALIKCGDRTLGELNYVGNIWEIQSIYLNIIKRNPDLERFLENYAPPSARQK